MPSRRSTWSPIIYAGSDRFEARAKVVEEITSEDLAVMTRADDARLGSTALNPITKMQTKRYRLLKASRSCSPLATAQKVVIEPMLTDQWFVDAEKVVGPALDAVKNGTVKIIPSQARRTYYHWLENIKPWCISRQLWWGHQIPVWYGPSVIEGKSIKDDGMSVP